ncbi:hypothetical protein V2A60_007161 [Cordyceps javanica]|uniref:Aminoglycoside phosphotransferase n=1 Tax=Cordyceps javanica TaxID=43265 RepID=A0A545VRF8_9HYPO|nr:Aminoglycoside phosphotransferase [Cordyceps javanica]TQW04289.1 Aminoglycoside phosphotransferase [Cordyceps javanica]
MTAAVAASVRAVGWNVLFTVGPDHDDGFPPSFAGIHQNPREPTATFADMRAELALCFDGSSLGNVRNDNNGGNNDGGNNDDGGNAARNKPWDGTAFALIETPDPEGENACRRVMFLIRKFACSIQGAITSDSNVPGSAMTTRDLLSGPITFSAASRRSTNVLQSLLYPQRKLAFYSYIQERFELLAELVAHHLGTRPDEILVAPQAWWRHGSFNLCIPVRVNADLEKTGLPQFVMIRFPLPYRVGEVTHPGNSDEKLRCEAATYAWIDENCPDVPIPKLFGFGLGTNERFTKLNLVPWWSRWYHEARCFILSTAGYEQPSQYVCHNSSCLDTLGIGYLLIESIAVGRGNMLSETWAQNRDDARFYNLQRDIARIMVSLAQHPLPRIGTFSIDSGGYLRLDNRPISVESTVHENEGLTPIVSRRTTFSSVKDFIFSQISTFETRFLEQPNAIVSRRDALYQMTGLAAARIALPQLLRDDNGPFVFALRDLHRSNVFVDQNWNVTAIIDLEFAASWPAEFIQTPHWLEYDFIDDVTPAGFEARHTEFMEHIKRAEELRENSGTESLSSIMQRSWDEGTFWVPLTLRDPVSFAELFYERILTGYFDFTAEEIKDEQNYHFCSRIFRRNFQSIIDKKLDDQRTYSDGLEEAFADPKSDLA